MCKMKLQGLFLKRQTEVSAQFAELVSSEILTSQAMWEVRLSTCCAATGWVSPVPVFYFWWCVRQPLPPCDMVGASRVALNDGCSALHAFSAAHGTQVARRINYLVRSLRLPFRRSSTDLNLLSNCFE